MGARLSEGVPCPLPQRKVVVLAMHPPITGRLQSCYTFLSKINSIAFLLFLHLVKQKFSPANGMHSQWDWIV